MNNLNNVSRLTANKSRRLGDCSPLSEKTLQKPEKILNCFIKCREAAVIVSGKNDRHCRSRKLNGGRGLVGGGRDRDEDICWWNWRIQIETTRSGYMLIRGRKDLGNVIYAWLIGSFFALSADLHKFHMQHVAIEWAQLLCKRKYSKIDITNGGK